MPSGVYVRKRTPAQLAMWKKNLAKGREEVARKKATAKLKKLGKNPEWRKRVSQATKAAMQRPEVRKKHLKGLVQARETHGINFRGGNGSEPLPLITRLANYLKPLGFKPEYRIQIGKARHGHPALTYRADFAHRESRVVIEIDGPCHTSSKAKQKDQRRDWLLITAGWITLRFTNKEAEDSPKRIAKIASRAVIDRMEISEH